MNACMHAQSLLFSVALRIFLPRPCPLPAILLVTPNWGHQLRHGHCGRLAHSGAVDARAIVRVPVERESCDKADHLQIAGVVANALARLTFPNPPGELPRGQEFHGPPEAKSCALQDAHARARARERQSLYGSESDPRRGRQTPESARTVYHRWRTREQAHLQISGEGARRMCKLYCCAIISRKKDSASSLFGMP